MARRAALALVRTPQRRPALPRPLAASARAAVIAALAVACLVLLYVAARRSSVFALETVRVKGGRQEVRQEVRQALAPLAGTSLVALDPDEVEQMLERVPVVRSAHVDRAFPHTLRVQVQGERPLAVFRAGADAWLVAESGRVLSELKPTMRLELPRMHVTLARPPRVGENLAGSAAAVALATLASLPRGLPDRVLYAEVEAGGVTLVLARTRLEVRLGEPTELEAKLAAAVAVLRAIPAAESAAIGYVDVSVPERAVTGPKYQPSSETLDLTQIGP
jgi:cell division protein FtsQ